MKTVILAATALTVTSASVLARDVYSTSPDNDELGHVFLPAEVAFPVDYATTASIRDVRSVIKNDRATMPD